MTWGLTPRDYIGVEIPFDRSLLAAIDLRAVALFPDVVDGQSYVYPAIRYKLYGPGVSEEERTCSVNATLPGTFTLALGTNRVRIYLDYSAEIGLVGTLPRDGLSTATLVLTAVTPDDMPAFGERVYGLKLTSEGTRVTVPAGTTIGNPLHLNITEAVTSVTTYKRFLTIGLTDYADLWTEIPLTKAPEHELGFSIESYEATPGRVVVNASMTISTAEGKYDFGTFPQQYSVYAIDSNGVLQGPLVRDAGDPNMANTQSGKYGWFIPPGSTTILLRSRMLRSLYDSSFAPAVISDGFISSYFVLKLFKRIYITGYAGINWRIPAQVYIQNLHAGQDVSAAPWAGLIL